MSFPLRDNARWNDKYPCHLDDKYGCMKQRKMHKININFKSSLKDNKLQYRICRIKSSLVILYREKKGGKIFSFYFLRKYHRIKYFSLAKRTCKNPINSELIRFELS